MKKYIFSVIFLFCALFLQAQILYVDEDFENFDYNIKQIDEFILRFNLMDLLIKPDQSDNYVRDNRTLLFDKKYYLENVDISNEFLTAVEKQNVSLSFYDSTWFAIAECNVLFKGKKDKLTLILRTEKVKEDIYKWSIMDAQGSMLSLTPKTQSDKMRILPTDNEVNFISLHSITTTNAANIDLFDIKSHVNDRLSAFNCLVYNNLLSIENVQELTYCFTQVKGFKFYVKNFLRDEKNAGWLICDIQKDDAKPTNKPKKTDKAIDESGSCITRFYEALSKYANNPSDIKLARNIQSMFYPIPKKGYFFTSKQVFDDINVYLENSSPLYAYVTISDYLNSLAVISEKGRVLSYSISDIKVVQSTDTVTYVTYKMEVYNRDTLLYAYYSKAAIKNGLIVDIMPLNGN